MASYPGLASLASIGCALVVALLVGSSGSSETGYAYAGYQAAIQGRGVRATITMTRSEVASGHVAGWVGVGEPEDGWVQAGVASVPGTGSFLYAEIGRAGQSPRLVVLARDVPVGRGYRVAVVEDARPGWWTALVDGVPVTESVRLGDGRASIVTSETRNDAGAEPNEFAFRFERVSTLGDSWRPFVPGHRFLDRGHTLRRVTSTPYTFVASSSRG